jgi:hypothetical protein
MILGLIDADDLSTCPVLGFNVFDSSGLLEIPLVTDRVAIGAKTSDSA